jgi:hypothetical protein
MKTSQNICPYTGLRAFTEDESLYFKGRDLQVDQVTSILEENKFLMVTGASGEGKSSLIYGGLVPNARAGFFKSKYTNWIIADFRPERNPVHNMSSSLAQAFHLNTATIETELKRGYSSLVDLYTNSPYFIDEESHEWQELDEAGKTSRKRSAANLMVIVDQFEEFFTNPENFYNEAPSQDSQIVVNLVLETARIAIKRNLPVYVVCTMRSDYIGQCAAFRGLPEYIGFSQFFVPRLKRKDLKQVIEEPAILSGNKISQRLIERLVYDIAEGIDQLPILQHALSQVWLAADHGEQEMDLLHYAMVGGMPENELPDDAQADFRRWFEKLPEVQKKYFHSTGLDKVIEIHASLLYENAWEYYNKKNPRKPITQKDAKRIIALAFSCLTKIDHSRAVRNRMSLGEITEIINTPSITSEVVDEVLTIYREEGNSFLRPFKTSDPSTHTLSPSTVLDITHESLIRNWSKLNTWANQEFEFYNTYQDFKKQLDRWQNSNKSSNFLLPIGPLSYFENWYDKAKPNAGWIKRYSVKNEDPVKANKDAENILSQVREFLKRSARKVRVSRAFMKYGPKRIATVAAIFAMLVLTGFYWYDAEQKQNDKVVKEVRKEMATLLKSTELDYNTKSFALLMNERYEEGYVAKYLLNLQVKDRISQATEVYKTLLTLNLHDTSAIKRGFQQLINDNFQEYKRKNPDPEFLLTQGNKITSLYAYDQYYNENDKLQALTRESANSLYEVILKFYRTPSLFQGIIPPELNLAVQQWLTFGDVTPQKLDELLTTISPFENPLADSAFNKYYFKGGYESNGRGSNDYNGGYHTLTSLYAARGDMTKLIRCFEEIKSTGQNDYFTVSMFNNYNNILGTLYQFGHRDQAPQLLQWLVKNYESDPPLTVYRNSVIRSSYLSPFYRANIEKNVVRTNKGYFFPNLCLSDRKIFNALSDDFEKEISKVPDADERNYLMAMQKKRRALFNAKYNYDRQFKTDQALEDSLFSQAISHFKQVSTGYLEQTVPITHIYYTDGVRNRNFKRRLVFLYPDYMDGWFSYAYHSDAFFQFMQKNNLFNELYKTPEDLGFIHLWLSKAYEVKPYAFQAGYDNTYPLSDQVLLDIIRIVDTHPVGKNLDETFPDLLLMKRYFQKGDTATAMKYYNRFKKQNIAAARDKYEYLEKTFFENQLKDVCAFLALYGKENEATALAELFEKNYEKAFTYNYMADQLYVKQNNPLSFVYLDSVFSKSKDIDFSQFAFGTNTAIDFRFNLILTLKKIGGRKLNKLADELIKDIIIDSKFGGLIASIYGMTEEGNFYNAKAAIPATLTEFEDLLSRTVILWRACQQKESSSDSKRWKAMDDNLARDFEYVNYNPI